MAATNQPPTEERTQTDSSLRAERLNTDRELAKSRARIDEDADVAIARVREQADETLASTRSKADAALDSDGATPEVRATTKAAHAKEDVAQDMERRAVDSGRETERGQRRRAIATLLQEERHQTDKHLLLERACSDDAFKQILAELVEAARLRDEFVTLASHELRTPLTPLALRLDSLAREAAKDPGSPFAMRVGSYIEAADKQVRKLAALVAGLLDVTRLTAGKLVIQLEPVDFGAVVRDVVSRYSSEVAKVGCALEVDAPSVVGRWNELRLEQVVANLLDNAIKFGRGKPIRIRLQADFETARLTVEDWGLGIEPNHLARIFERFERAVPKENYGGLGLGLYICRSVVEAMGGTITAQSEVGRGSTFTVELPLSGTKLPAGMPDEACHAPQ